MTKLKNIDAIRKMVDGEHRLQTRTVLGYEKTTPHQKRQVGEIWTDEDGTEWIQKDGYRANIGKLDSVRELLKSMRFPSTCPECKNEMKPNQYNKKMWSLHKMCFDCVIEMEHNLRLEGKYEEYEKSKIQNNIKSWLTDVRAELEDLKKILTEDTFFPNTDGTLETWHAPYKNNKEELYDMIEKEYQELEMKLLSYGQE